MAPSALRTRRLRTSRSTSCSGVTSTPPLAYVLRTPRKLAMTLCRCGCRAGFCSAGASTTLMAWPPVAALRFAASRSPAGLRITCSPALKPEVTSTWPSASTSRSTLRQRAWPAAQTKTPACPSRSSSAAAGMTQPGGRRFLRRLRREERYFDRELGPQIRWRVFDAHLDLQRVFLQVGARHDRLHHAMDLALRLGVSAQHSALPDGDLLAVALVHIAPGLDLPRVENAHHAASRQLAGAGRQPVPGLSQLLVDHPVGLGAESCRT